MPKKSKAVRVGVPVTSSYQNATVHAATVTGRPPAPVVQQTFPVIVRPSYTKAGVTRLLKRDVSKGLSMPEADQLPFISGVMNPGSMSYGGKRIMHLQPLVPPRSGKNVKVIAPPSPTNNGGVRSPYNQKVSVARIKKSQRYG
jgi:hypothetical protein